MCQVKTASKKYQKTKKIIKKGGILSFLHLFKGLKRHSDQVVPEFSVILIQ